jgi:RimJ/RimL family protein N-acetyltransferase
MNAEPFELESERLRLRRFSLNDLPSFLSYRSDPEVARYQGWGGMNEAQARAFIEAQRLQPVARAGEWLQIALERRADGQHIGDVAMKTDGEGQAEFGYTLARAFQVQGYMTEAARRLLGFLFAELGLHRVSARADVRNTPSQRVLERLGFRREAHFVEAFYIKGEWTSEYLYALLRREWQARG